MSCKAALKKHKLSAPTAHIGIDRLRSDLDGAAKLAKDFGVKELIVPAVAPEERPNDAEGWRKLGRSSPAIRRSSRRTASTSPGTTTTSSSPSSPTAAIRSTTSSPRRPASSGRPTSAGSHGPARIRSPGSRNTRDRVTALHIKDLAPKGENAGRGRLGRCRPRRARLEEADAGDQAPGVKYLVMEHDNPSDFERFARRSFADRIRLVGEASCGRNRRRHHRLRQHLVDLPDQPPARAGREGARRRRPARRRSPRRRASGSASRRCRSTRCSRATTSTSS